MPESDLVCAIDPGRDKCGVAVVGRDGSVRYREVIDAGRLSAVVGELAGRFALRTVVVGDRTGARDVIDSLRAALGHPRPGAGPRPEACCPKRGVPPGAPGNSPAMPGFSPSLIEVFLVDEHLTSVEARRRYLADHPGRGLSRLLPAGLRTPDRPYDDYVAVILAERFFAGRWKQKLSIVGRS